jgi:threonine aldolase
VKKVQPVETNIIIFEVDERQISGEDFVQKLLKKEIYIIGMGQGKLRMVTHLDYNEGMHEELLRVLKTL